MAKKKKEEVKNVVDLKNKSLEEQVNIIIENQENLSKVKPKQLKEFIQQLEVAEFLDQQHYCNLMVETLEENTLKHVNSEKVFSSDTMQKILRSLV